MQSFEREKATRHPSHATRHPLFAAADAAERLKSPLLTERTWCTFGHEDCANRLALVAKFKRAQAPLEILVRAG